MDSNNDESLAASAQLVECPGCQKRLPYTHLNPHLDRCLAQDSQAVSCQTVRPIADIFTPKFQLAPPPTQQSQTPSRHVANTSSPSAEKRSILKVEPSTPLYPAKRARMDEQQQPEQAAGMNPNQKNNNTADTSSIHAGLSNNNPVTARDRVDAVKPFAERMRPQTLSEFVGQSEVIDGPLKMLLKQGKIPSMILWGPPGTGKTTLARLLAKSIPSDSSDSHHHHHNHRPSHRFVEISATTAGTSDVKKIIDEALHRLQLTGQRTLLFIDEIQRFNRAQQDVFLPSVEKGQIVLVAATTENPSFRLQGALISRMRVFVLTKLSVDECSQVLTNALDRLKLDADRSDVDQEAMSHIDSDLIRWIATMADGDARTALGALEIALSTTDPSLSSSENVNMLKKALARTALQYDRTGDRHYDTISALHKSIRGSDPDAALYWLARMVCSGDDPLFIARRLIVAASEDINTVQALQMATATYQACQVVGLPECAHNLAHCVVYLAESSKSTRTYRAWKKVKTMVETQYNYPVPLHIRNAPTALMKSIGYGKEYRYEPSFAHPVYQEFFPPELKTTRFLSPPLEEEQGSTQAEPTTLAQSTTLIQPDTLSNGTETRQSTFNDTSDQVPEGQDQHHQPDSVRSTMEKQAAIGAYSCRRVFELGARAVDLDLLDEWEKEKNGGKEWKGRRQLMKLVESFGKAKEYENANG